MSLSGFDALFAGLGRLAALESDIHKDEQAIAEEMAQAMRNELGTYQEGWPELTDATQAERVREGYSADDPLLRGGDLQGAITAWPEGEAWLAGVPADSDQAVIAATQEEGSLVTGVPPRPFIRPIADDYGQHMVDHVIARIDQSQH